MRTLILVSAALALAACGGPSTTEPDDETVATSGGEAPSEDTPVPPPIRTTTPVPVPQPAVAREELSPAVQDVWSQVEEAVAIAPPEGPTEATEESVEEWSNGPFREWIDQRTGALSGALARSREVAEEPTHERAVASALIGYALEDFVAAIRSSPVPQGIAHDPELLELYVSSLMEVLRPVATESVISYAYCQQRLSTLGDESDWLPWRAYCVQRGQEIIEVYELAPAAESTDGEAEPAADDDAPDEAPVPSS